MSQRFRNVASLVVFCALVAVLWINSLSTGPRQVTPGAADLARDTETAKQATLVLGGVDHETPQRASPPPPAVAQPRAASTLRGMLLDAETEAPVANGRVYVLASRPRKQGAAHLMDLNAHVDVASGLDGEFALPLSSEQSPHVCVTAPGYAPRDFPPAAIEEVRKSDAPLWRVVLRPVRGSIRGRVIDERQRPVARCLVWCRAATSRVTSFDERTAPWQLADDGASHVVETAPDGSFQVLGLDAEKHYLLSTRLPFHVQHIGDTRRIRPGATDVTLRVRAVAIIAWRLTRTGRPVKAPDGLLSVVVKGDQVAAAESALPPDVRKDALVEAGYTLRMVARANNELGTDDAVILIFKSLQPGSGFDSVTVPAKIGELVRVDYELEVGEEESLEVVAAFPGGAPFDGRLLLSPSGGEPRVLSLRAGRAWTTVPKGCQAVEVRPSGLAAFAWAGGIQVVRGGAAEGRPLQCEVRGTRVDLEVRSATGDRVPTFDILVRLDSRLQQGWEPNYVYRLIERGELNDNELPFLWLPPGEHLVRVNDPVLGLAEQIVAVPQDGGRLSVGLRLDPAKGIDLTKPREQRR